LLYYFAAMDGTVRGSARKKEVMLRAKALQPASTV